jgi:tetratricopeptide (TPR) repeat protein
VRHRLDEARVASALGSQLIMVTIDEAQQRLEGAQNVYADVFASQTRNADARWGLALTLARLSRCAIERGYADDAFALAREALDTAGERRPELLGTLAAAQFVNGWRDEAIATAKEALAIIGESPADARAKARRARIVEELGEYRK